MQGGRRRGEAIARRGATRGVDRARCSPGSPGCAFAALAGVEPAHGGSAGIDRGRARLAALGAGGQGQAERECWGASASASTAARRRSKDFEMRDGVIDVDVATPAQRGFFGIQFRIANDGANGEWVYLRQHKSGHPDAMQYTPVLNTGAQLAALQRPRLHRRGRHSARRLVPPAPGGRRRAGEALRQGHGQARARDGRPEERHPEGTGRAARSDRRDVLLELRGARRRPTRRGSATCRRCRPDTLTQVEHLAGRTTRSRATSSGRCRAAETRAIHWQDVEAEPPGFVVHLSLSRERRTRASRLPERLLEAAASRSRE